MNIINIYKPAIPFPTWSVNKRTIVKYDRAKNDLDKIIQSQSRSINIIYQISQEFVIK